MKYLLTLEAFKSEMLTKAFNQLKDDYIFKERFIKGLLNNIDLDIANLDDKYFQYLPADEAKSKRGDFIKIWVSLEHGVFLITRKNVSVDSYFNEDRSKYGRLGKSITIPHITRYGRQSSVTLFDINDYRIDDVTRIADYAILFDIEAAKKDGINLFDKRDDRKKQREGALALVSDEYIKSQNIMRYKTAIVKAYDIKDVNIDTIFNFKRLLLRYYNENMGAYYLMIGSYPSNLNHLSENYISIIKDTINGNASSVNNNMMNASDRVRSIMADPTLRDIMRLDTDTVVEYINNILSITISDDLKENVGILVSKARDISKYLHNSIKKHEINDYIDIMTIREKLQSIKNIIISERDPNFSKFHVIDIPFTRSYNTRGYLNSVSEIDIESLNESVDKIKSIIDRFL